ncbi:EamA-like transporter family [uncultured Pleomorphomonas sp.]|uniref:EamA-like transporter family n=1 Tax=uncultured Pleomorphomonas sp. TaxID=442121 RepID=A0A212LH45_9HYPH|nr:DMT family transporter [uncultured Pleomorphomonas sp.]SCM76865.1 EamA-like transporter family [uncultured Pleomorphomonas sp.]
MTAQNRPLSLADAMLAAAALLAGAGWLFSIQAIREIPPLIFIGSRFLVAGIFVLPFADDPSAALRRSSQAAWLLAAGVMLGASMMLWIVGLKLTGNPGVAAFISAMGNLMVPLVGAGLFGWPVGRRLRGAMVLAVIGLGLLFVGPAAAVDASHAIFAVSAGLWAASIAFVKKVSTALTATTVTAVQLIVAGLAILLVALPLEGGAAHWPTIAGLGWFAASVLIATCLRFLLQFRGQQLVSAGRAGLFMCFEPVWTLLFSVVFLGLMPTPFQLLGCLVIFLAVFSMAARERI